MGELRRHFRDTTWAIKVPRRLKDRYVALTSATEFLSGRNGRPPTPAEVADHLGLTVEEVLEGLEAADVYRTKPFVREDDDGHREPAVLGTEDRPMADADDRLMLEQALATLPPRERTILELRFYNGLSQTEIAKLVGVSQVHVSRLIRKSLESLQQCPELAGAAA